MLFLGGDVGGTKTLLRCVDEQGRVVLDQRFENADRPSFEELLDGFLSQLSSPVKAACFGVAGPVLGARAEVTNIGWVLETAALEQRFGIGRVAIVNDFHAIALGVPVLGDSDLVSLQRGTRVREGPIGILGAGTGLGEAILVWAEGRFHVLPNEGGHGDFAPQNEEQARLFLELHSRYGHVSWERLVSGMGLTNIAAFLGAADLPPAEVAERAAQGDVLAKHAVSIFIDLYGAEAGNMALRILARGGVFLAGGIAAKNVPWFTDGRFLESFRRKGRFSELMSSIPVDLILNEEVGLIGAVEEARRIAGSGESSTAAKG